MISRWRWAFRLVLRRIWFRAALFSLSSVLLALLAAVVAPFIPYEIGTKIGSEAVDNILEILASSMLAVTTFSLTAMVSAFAGATSTITPRATRLLVQDSTAQNALSTFLGAFLFSIVGICALSTGIYGKSGRVILFIGTILVIAIIVVTLLRWIEHLSRFGRVGDTIQRVEAVAIRAAAQCGFRVTIDPAGTPPGGGTAICPDRIGYVTHVDIGVLDRIARHRAATIAVAVTPGSFVTPQRPLARRGDGGDGAGGGDGDDREIRDAFTIDRSREFDHDPRFGLVVLAEIGARALSPAVNDPGTAIAVLGAGVRVMAALLEPREDDPDPPALVHLPMLALDDLLDDLIRPIARDGAGMVEVAIRLQRALGEIAALAPAARPVLARHAAAALARAEMALGFEPDRAAVRAAHDRSWHAAG